MNILHSRNAGCVGRARREQKGETTSYGKQAHVSSRLSRLVGFYSLEANKTCRLPTYDVLTTHETFLQQQYEHLAQMFFYFVYRLQHHKTIGVTCQSWLSTSIQCWF